MNSLTRNIVESSECCISKYLILKSFPILRILPFIRILSILPILLILPILSTGQTALEIVKKADAKMRGNTSQVEMNIKTIRPSWSREMDLRVWSKGNDFAMILIQSPARDRGITFLKRGKEVWNWIPTLEKTIKLPPSMMSQSWMGTDFTNDDLVRESSVIRDFEHSLGTDTLILGRPCHTIWMVPKPEAAVVWGKLMVCIDKKDFMELHTRFYDEEGQLVNIMNAYDPALLGGRLIPTRFEIIPVEKRNQKTEMRYKKVVYDQPIADGFFSINNMKNIR